MLARNPGATALATIALALGIGGSTVIFSVVNAVLLRPLPFSDPDRLVWIWANSPSRNLAFAFTAYSTYAEWKAGCSSFESMSAYAPAQVPVVENGRAVGILDESDLLLAVHDDESHFRRPVREAMTSRLETVPPTASLNDVERILDQGLVALVVENDHFLGLITRSDLLSHLRRRLK